MTPPVVAVRVLGTIITRLGPGIANLSCCLSASDLSYLAGYEVCSGPRSQQQTREQRHSLKYNGAPVDEQ